MADKCKRCKFWKRLDPTYGRCNRYPPTGKHVTYEQMNIPAVFPIVAENEVCGEFVQETQ